MKQIVPTGTAMIAVTYGLARYSYGLFLPEIRADLGLSSLTLSLIASCSYAGYLLAICLSIIFVTFMEPRWLITLGGLSACIGILIVALADSPWVLMIAIFLAGMGSGWVYPAIPEVLASLIHHREQKVALAWINSGTSFGVMLSGPIAIWNSNAWRPAWLTFCVLSVLITFWTAKVIPHLKLRHSAKPTSLNINLYLRDSARPLFIIALALGISSSVYWTFAVDLIMSLGRINIDGIAQIFWTVVGIFGIFGAFVGNLLSHFGLHLMIRFAMLGLAISLCLLALNPASLLNILLSGILFGAGFIVLTGLLAIWSVEIYRDRPSAGHGASLFLICLGQLLGPLIAGILLIAFELPTIFYLSSLLALIVSFWVKNS